MLLQMALFRSLYGQVVFHYVYMRIFFIYSSAGEQLGCFPVLTIVSSAAMIIGVHVLLN